MEKFETLTGVAAPLNMTNVDTDMIIPKQFLKTIKRTGLKEGLFFEMRWDEDGNENFGCGSSREHAPWALLDFGIRCVIAPDFADIFYNNCFKNGILPIKLPQEQVDMLMEDAGRGANATVTIDLEALEITRPDGEKISFEVDSFRRHCLLNGLDDIGLTLQKKDKIDSFEAKRKDAQPWL
jgi:3-isopropylmalate/(R)-2-methylmalate dehydratase small subunit